MNVPTTNTSLDERKFMSLDQETRYLAAYRLQKELFSPWFGFIGPRVYLIIVVFGIAGFILLLSVIFRNQFGAPSFIYHKTISLVTTVLLIVALVINVAGLTRNNTYCEYIEVLLFDARLANVVTNSLGSWSEFIALFVSVERFVAMLMPTHFHRINNNRFAITTSVLSSLALLLNLPDAFLFRVECIKNGCCRATNSDVSSNQYFKLLLTSRNYIFGLQSLVMLAFTTLVVFGLLRRKSVRRHLTANATAATPKHQAKKDLQLCLLQLAVTIPLVLDRIMYVVQVMYTIPEPIPDDATATLTYEDARALLNKWIVLQSVRVCTASLLHIAHASNFYLYMALHERFRQEVMNELRQTLTFCCRIHNQNIRIQPSAERSHNIAAERGHSLSDYLFCVKILRRTNAA